VHETLNDTDLAKIQTKLVIPVIVGLILRGEEPMDEVAEFSMHDMIGHMEPDTAALCIALASQHLVANCEAFPVVGALYAESTMVINDYAPLWLAYVEGAELDDFLVSGQLRNLPEDLDSMADLLDSVQDTLNDPFSTEAILCEILSLQARAHGEYAEKLLMDDTVETHSAPESRHTDNVIPFPKMA
jgi:hypothetical protein